MRHTICYTPKHKVTPLLLVLLMLLLLPLLPLPLLLAICQPPNCPRHLHSHRPATNNHDHDTYLAPGYPSLYLFVITEPTASMTDDDTKFSEGMSSRPCRV